MAGHQETGDEVTVTHGIGWRVFWLRAVAVVILVVIWALPPAAAEQRYALVIGNSAYSKSPLANPRNDAQSMSASLAAAGFSVATVTDADLAAMRQAILEFGRRLRGSDSVGLFYYAGHGVQVDGENYLIPVGADITDESEVPLLALGLGELLKTMERAESRLNIAILDACRDNPYATGTRSLSRGLAPVKAPAGTLIAFATGPGQVALDGKGPNSPYSGALSQSILEFGVPLEETFRRTRRIVLEATSKKQVPWEHSSLTGEFFFRPKLAEPEARISSTSDIEKSHLAELAEWSLIKDTSDVPVLRQHMQRFPDGMFRELAALKIERLSVPQSPWSMTVTGSVATVATRNEQIDSYEQGLKIESAVPDAAGYAQAAALYRKAAERGLAQATYRLARLYDKGLGVGQDRAEAARLYAEAADKGFAPAMSALATMREFGEAGARDMAEALRLYRRAADAGDATAMTSLGYLHETGKGVVRDAAAARRWYESAVALGDVRAMFNLALMTMRGGGGTLVEAVRLLETATERGHAGARRELAFLYDEGRGVARNPERAATLLLAALEAGDDGAERDALQRTNAWSYATRRAIQRQLASRGLYRGEAHGVFNHSTKNALRRVATGS